MPAAALPQAFPLLTRSLNAAYGVAKAENDEADAGGLGKRGG
jgi:hypothetical protein